ncbi:RnaseH-domain-containing protein [Trametes meyenii]|nr:RnaseH-domain-containing protein [Trametes meyenii]
MAGREAPPFAPLHIVSDSRYAINGLTKHLRKWEERGWIGVANAKMFQEAAATLRARSALTTMRWVKGHEGVEGNEAADKLAAEGTDKPAPVQPDRLLAPRKFLHQGAALAKMMQKLAYRGIREVGNKIERRKTETNLERIRSEVKQATKLTRSVAQVWVMLRKDPIQRKVRDYLWKAIHGAQRVGAFWKHIPGYEQRAVCEKCGVEESMEHILTECEAVGQKQLWRRARAVLETKGLVLPEMTLGLVLGGHMIAKLGPEGREVAGVSRLAKIVMTETAYLVWTLRCERVIGREGRGEKEHTTREVEARWESVMNRRFRMDKDLTKKRVAGPGALKEKLVKETWEWRGISDEEPGRSWSRWPGVLVGMPNPSRNDDEPEG